jgi:hypothetical protein
MAVVSYRRGWGELLTRSGCSRLRANPPWQLAMLEDATCNGLEHCHAQVADARRQPFPARPRKQEYAGQGRGHWGAAAAAAA